MTGSYVDFPTLGAGALDALAARHGATVSEDDRKELRQATTSMPAFPDAAPALERLRAGGVRVAALTNSPAASAR